jgi:hypothetical protein
MLQQLDYCDNSNRTHDALIILDVILIWWVFHLILDVSLKPWTYIHMKYKFLYEKYLQLACILNILKC